MPSSQTEIRLADPVTIMSALREHMAEHEIEIVAQEEKLVARLNNAEARMRASDGLLALEADADSAPRLEEVIAFLASHVREFAAPQTPEIVWSGVSGDRLPADFREMTVLRAFDLTPHMRRITLKGDDLARFATDADLHVRLFFAPPGQPPVWPMRGADGLIQPIAADRKPQMRKYTIRRIDVASGEVDVDFVIHEIAGPGSDWAARAQAGDLVGMAGPGGRTARPADWMLLAGDETALPAIARILEGLPEATSGHVIMEVADVAGKLTLEKPRGMNIEWLVRDAGAPTLAARVMEIAVPQSGTRFCWAGAEFADIQAIRQYWREECDLKKDEQLAVAYWRRGEALL